MIAFCGGHCIGEIVTVPSGMPVTLKAFEKPEPEAHLKEAYEWGSPRDIVVMLPPSALIVIFEGSSRTRDTDEPPTLASEAASIIARTTE